MEAIIVLILSVVGASLGDIDFFTLYTRISTALHLYRTWINIYTMIKCVIPKYIRENTERHSVEKHSQNQANNCTKDNR